MKEVKKNKVEFIGRSLRLLLSVFFIVSSLPLSAQTPVKVTEESDLEDGHLYTFSYENKSNGVIICKKITFDTTTGKERFSYDYEFVTNDMSYNILQTNVKAFPVFRTVRENGKIYLLYVLNQKYFGYPSGGLIPMVDEISSSYYTKRTKVKKSNCWAINDKMAFSFKKDVHKFGAYSINSNKDELEEAKNMFIADLYTCDNVPDYGDVQLSQDKDLETYTLSDGTVAFYRDFKDGVLNTLILPLDVPNYKKVFGLGTTAYEAQAGSEENVINFKKVADDETLKANTPYLITGVFFSQPYIIPGASLSTDGSDPAEFAVNNNISIVGRYKREEGITGTNVYGLKSSGDVVRLGSSASASVSPYRWYVRTSGSGNAKISISGVETTAIGTVKTAVQPKESAVYSLQGVKIAQGDRPAASLPHGVYIMNGKKIVK